MKNNLTKFKSLLVLMIALITCSPQMWGADVTFATSDLTDGNVKGGIVVVESSSSSNTKICTSSNVSCIVLSTTADANYNSSTDNRIAFKVRGNAGTITGITIHGSTNSSTTNATANGPVIFWNDTTFPNTAIGYSDVAFKSYVQTNTCTNHYYNLTPPSGTTAFAIYKRVKFNTTTNAVGGSESTYGGNTALRIDEIVITLTPGGGGGATTYDVNMAAMSNGSVTASPTSQEEGEDVTLTVSPSTGYELSGDISVIGDESGDDITATDNGDGTWTFEMPAEDVTVSASFSPKSYTVTLNSQSATSAGTENVTTTYNSNTNLTSAITKPTKTGYVFAGYFTATNGGGTQLIDPAGNWIASAGGGSTYLDASKNWKNDGNLTLYACWMEYASTFDIQKYVQDSITDGKTSTNYTILETNKLIYSLGGSSALDNSNKSSYEGLKMKNSGDYVMFLVKANSALKLYFGYTGTDPKKSINGGAESNMGVSSTGTETANQEVDLGTQTYDRLVKVRTVNGNAVVLQKIDITAAAVGYTVTYNGSSAGGGSVPVDGTTYSNNAEVTVLGNTGELTRTIDGCTARFLGWSTNSNMYGGTHYTAGQTFNITGNTTLYAIWGFNIGYYEEDGETAVAGMVPTSYIYGEGATLPTASKTGYNGTWYNEWCVNEKDEGGCDSGCGFDDQCITTTISSSDICDADYLVKWTAKSCTVSFDNNDGTGGTNTVTATYGSSLPSKASNLPTKTGYNFDGYYDSETDNDGTGTKYYNADGSSARNWDKDTESATTLYAKWTAKTTTITIDANTTYHGSTTPGTVTATYGSALPSFTAAAGESGYSLTGYYTAATDGDKIINANGTLVASTSYADGSGNWNSEAATLTLYAQYVEDVTTYNVTYDGDSPTTGSAPTDDTDYTSGAEVTVLGDNSMKKTGCTFVGWSDGTTLFLEGQKFNITSNVTLTAVWNAESEGSCKLVDIDFTDETTVSLSSTDTKTVDGVDVYFKGFTSITNGTGAIPYGNMSSNANYLAIPISGINGSISFTVTGENRPQLKYYILQYDALPGEITDPGNTTNIDRPGSGSSVTVSDVSVSKSYAVLYLGRQSATNQIGTVSVTTPCSVSSGYTVSFEDQTGFAGSSTLPDDIAGIPSGKKLVQPADPTATGYTFGGWYSNAACTAGNEINWSTMTISADKTIYAKWTAKTTTVTINANTGNHGSTAPSAFTATYGQALPEFTAATGETGYHLVGYYTDATSGTKVIDADGTFSANSGIWDRTDGATLTLYAQYAINTYTVNFAVSSAGYGSVDVSEITGVTHGSTVSIADNVLTLKETDVTATATSAGSDYSYAFSSWSVSDGASITSAQTITANFTRTAKQYSVAVTLTDSKATQESGSTGANAATYGTNYVATFEAITDYVLPSDVTVQIGGVTKTKGTEYTWSISAGVGTVTITGSYITGNIAITVTARSSSYHVTYDGDSPTTGSAPTNETDYAGDGTETVTIEDDNGMTKTGYTFRGWSDGTTFFLAGQSFRMPAHDVTLTAVWEPNSIPAETLFSVDFSESKWSSVSFNQGNTETADVHYGITFYSKSSDKQFSISSGELSFPNNNMANSNYFMAIPITGVNGAITVTVTNTVSSSSNWNVKYVLKEGTDIETPGSSGTGSTAAQTTTTFTVPSLKKSNYVLYLGRSSSGDQYKKVKTITITTPGVVNHFDVEFEDGETAPESHTAWPDDVIGVESGLKILAPSTTPSATGYTYGGWFTNAKCTTEVNYGTMTITADTKIYAKWTAKTTTVTINANTGNHGSTAPSAFTATYGQALPEFTAATGESGWKLDGYYDAATSGTKVINADGTFSTNSGIWNRLDGDALTLYAQYVEAIYTITYNANGGSCATPTATQESVGEELTLPTPTWSGYTFDGWYNAGDNIGDAGDKYEPTEDITLYAKWTDNIDGKLFSYVDGNYGDKYKSFDGTWVTADATEKDKTFTNAITGVQFVIDDGCWDKKAGLVSLFAKHKVGTTSMQIIIPAGYKATVKIIYGAYGTDAATYSLTVNGEQQAGPASTKLSDNMTSIDGKTCEVTLTNQTGTLTLSSKGGSGKNLYIVRVAATITGYQTLTYVGGSGSNWSTTANWSPACLPTIEHDVVLNAPVTVDVEHAKAKSVVIYNNGSDKTGKLTIQPNKGLEVTGLVKKTTDGSSYTCTSEADLILESSSAGNASLVFDNSNNNHATVALYSKASVEGSTWNWQYIGTALSDANALYDYYGSYLYKWSGGWTAVANGANMEAFAGYCIANKTANTTYITEGTLVPTTSHSVDIAAGKDMVLANSWTAPISIASFTNTTFTSTPATVYLFNTGSAVNGSSEGSEAGTYIAVPIASAPYTGNGLIAPQQGFFVTAKNGTAGTITMNYSELVRPAGSHTDIVAGPMKSPVRRDMPLADYDPNVMKIKVSGSVYTDRVIILERADFTEGFDNGWDGERKGMGKVSPSIYVINAEGKKDAVSAIPDYEGTLVGFKAGSGDTEYVMTFNYDGDDILYLNDLKEETSTQISEGNTYTFTTESGDSDARFVISATPFIKTTPTGLDDAEWNGNGVRKVIHNDHMYIIRGGRVFDATGGLVK